MEIDLNKEESTEISIFINFSIRDYVADIRKKNPVKCWPFGSLPDKKIVSSYQSSKSTFFSGQDCPSNTNGSRDTTELTEASNYMTESLGIASVMGKVICNGSAELTFCKVNKGESQHEINNVDEGAKMRHNEAADNNKSGRNRPQRKPHKFRLLSDIYKDPASELHSLCERTNPENVNKRFVAETEDESDDSDDDVTLAAYFRKQKGVEVRYSRLNKKRDMIGVKDPSVDQDKKSNLGSKSIGKTLKDGTSSKKSRTDETDTHTMPKHKKDFQLQCSHKSNHFAEVRIKEATEKEKENEDSEMEAVMLLAHHFTEQKQILRELKTNPTCACVKKKIREHSTQSGNTRVTKTSSKTATKRPVKNLTEKKLQNCATLLCSFNRNPADFSTPDSINKFMRGC